MTKRTSACEPSEYSKPGSTTSGIHGITAVNIVPMNVPVNMLVQSSKADCFPDICVCLQIGASGAISSLVSIDFSILYLLLLFLSYFSISPHLHFSSFSAVQGGRYSTMM